MQQKGLKKSKNIFQEKVEYQPDLIYLLYNRA